MRKLFIIPILILLAGPLVAQGEADHEVEASSSIDAVTVFLNQAQVTRTSEVLLRRGRNVVYFRGLATGIDARSIQFKAPKEVLINTVVHEVNYLNQTKLKPREQALLDSLEWYNEKIADEKTLQGILEQERKLLLANQSLASQKTGLDLAQLKAAADFFRERMGRINRNRLESARKVGDLKEEITRIKRQMATLNVDKNRASNDIRVVLSTYSTRKVPLEMKYLVSNASWVPRYDLRAKNSTSPIDLEYKADVYQNTGIDWKDISLTLSTGNPTLRGSQPELNPWNLYVYVPTPQLEVVYDKKSRSRSKTAEAYAMEDDEAEEESAVYAMDALEPGGPVTTLADYTQVVEGATTAEFQISVRQDIPTGNKPEQVTVQKEELPASYRYFSVPKIDSDAFLIAEVTEWEGLNLLPGSLNIFFEGTFVASSELDPVGTGDTLRFSLGRDQRIVVEREKLKDYCKTRTFGSNREKTFGYEIRVRNTKSEAISLRLEDQIPISQDKNITVKIEEISGASFNEKTGKLEWEMELEPSATRTFKLVYSVKWPKNKVVPNL